MFRILFFILICTLFFYGILGFYAPLKNINEQQVTQEYINYLSWALSRSIPQEELYRVVFYREDFIDTKKTNNYFSKTTTFDNRDEVSFLEKSLRYNISTGSEGITSKLDFPNTGLSVALWGWDSECKNGLIFDPCLVLDDPKPASGGMYFGSDRT